MTPKERIRERAAMMKNQAARPSKEPERALIGERAAYGLEGRRGMSEGGLYGWLCRTWWAEPVSFEDGLKIIRGEIE